MARLVTSAMNQAGTWQDEPRDQADRLAYQTHQQDRQDDWRKQLAFAQLAQNQNQFDQGISSRSDEFNKNYAMQDALAAAQINGQTMDRNDAADRYGKQFDYMGSRDKLNDDWRNKAFEQGNTRYEQERTDAQPYRELQLAQAKSGAGLSDVQTQIAKAQLADILSKQTASQNYKPTLRGPLTGNSKETYDEVFGATGDVKQATSAANSAMRGDAAKSADLAKNELTNSAANFNDRAGEWFDWSGRNTSSDSERIKGLYDAYKSALVKSGIEEADADRMARTAIDPILKNDPLIGSGVNSLRQALGLPGVK
jgi:hypothetical protein